MLHFSISSQEQFPKIVIPIEGCYTAISIKSFLNEKELFNSINNLSSIPLSGRIIKPNPNVKGLDKYIESMPLKIIFAYDGVSEDTVITYIAKLKKQNLLLPDMIIVNNEYYIWKVGFESITFGDINLNKNSMILESNSDIIVGKLLLHLLIKIQALSVLDPHILTGFDHYHQNIFDILNSQGKYPKFSIIIDEDNINNNHNRNDIR